MHKVKAYIYGCTIYDYGRKYCVHHPKESGHHKADTMAQAFTIAKRLGELYPVPVVEDEEQPDDFVEETSEQPETANE